VKVVLSVLYFKLFVNAIIFFWLKSYPQKALSNESNRTTFLIQISFLDLSSNSSHKMFNKTPTPDPLC